MANPCKCAGVNLDCGAVAACPTILDHRDRLEELEGVECAFIGGPGIDARCVGDGVYIGLKDPDCTRVRRCIADEGQGTGDFGYDKPTAFGEIAIAVKPSGIREPKVCEAIRGCVAKPEAQSGNDSIYTDKEGNIKVKRPAVADKPWVSANLINRGWSDESDETWETTGLWQVGGKGFKITGAGNSQQFECNVAGMYEVSYSLLAGHPYHPTVGGIRIMRGTEKLDESWVSVIHPSQQGGLEIRVGHSARSVFAVNLQVGDKVHIELNSVRVPENALGAMDVKDGSNITLHWIANPTSKPGNELEGGA